MMQAHTRDTTRYLNRLVPNTSIASICSVTFIKPNSAPMLEPFFHAQIRAVNAGPISHINDIPMISDMNTEVQNGPFLNALGASEPILFSEPVQYH